VWIKRGPWKRQHDAEFTSDGQIMLFDNRGGKGGDSRIVKVSPATGETTVLYEGSKEQPFRNPSRGMQQALPNGNILIQ
jgi:hypothetical protein